MIVIFHRGYIGFQPPQVSCDVSYSFTEMKIESFISEGQLWIPISDHDLHSNDLGNKENILNSYKTSRSIYYRYLQWDDRGAADNTYIKATTAPDGANPIFARVPLNTRHSTSAVLCQDMIDGHYLAAVVHADATLEQIDNFVREFVVGSLKPFVWTEYSEVKRLIIDSVDVDPIFPFREKREGPSRHLLQESKIEESINESIS